MARKILNYGSLNIDYVYVLDHIVQEGETESSLDYQVFEGGKGLNQSVALSRAGGEVYHAGRIGKEGVFLKEALENCGVDYRYLLTDEGANGHAIIQRSAEGENCIILYPGANHKITREEMDQVLEQFAAGDILVCQNEISEMEYLIDRAYEKGMKIAWNPSPITEVVNRIDFHKITWLIVNEIEGQAIIGEEEPEKILAGFREKYPQLCLVLTLGSDGSIYQDLEQTVTQERYSVPVKDTTAAGDTFLGYFISEIAKDEKTDVKKALQLASMAAAIAVSREGAMPSIPAREEVERELDFLLPHFRSV